MAAESVGGVDSEAGADDRWLLGRQLGRPSPSQRFARASTAANVVKGKGGRAERSASNKEINAAGTRPC